MRYRIDLKKEREKRGLTQAQLAKLIGVTEKSISKWESGRGQPSYENMLKICKEYSIDINRIDREAIIKRRVNILLNSCLIAVNLLVVITALYGIIKEKNISDFPNYVFTNAIEHLQLFKINYRADADRFYFILILFLFIPIINIFLPIILRKHFVIASLLAIVNILYCMMAFKNTHSILTNLIMFINVLAILAFLLVNYMMNNKFKGEMV